LAFLKVVGKHDDEFHGRAGSRELAGGGHSDAEARVVRGGVGMDGGYVKGEID